MRKKGISDIHIGLSLQKILQNYLNGSMTNQYICGIKIYDYLIKYVTNIQTYKVLPATNFQILVEHFALLNSVLGEVINNHYCLKKLYNKDKIDNSLTLLLKTSQQLRNYVMKIWYSKREIINWQDKICELLSYIQQEEEALIIFILNNIVR